MSEPQEDDFGEPCWECGYDGWVLADCFEDSCCCADPEEEHEYEPCRTCNSWGR